MDASFLDNDDDDEGSGKKVNGCQRSELPVDYGGDDGDDDDKTRI